MIYDMSGRESLMSRMMSDWERWWPHSSQHARPRPPCTVAGAAAGGVAREPIRDRATPTDMGRGKRGEENRECPNDYDEDLSALLVSVFCFAKQTNRSARRKRVWTVPTRASASARGGVRTHVSGHSQRRAQASESKLFQRDHGEDCVDSQNKGRATKSALSIKACSQHKQWAG